MLPFQGSRAKVDLVDINMVEITEFPDDNMVEEGTGESPDLGLTDVYQRP